MFYARKDRPSPDREIAEISEHLQQLSVRLAKLQGQQLTRDKQRVLEVNDATFLEQYVHLRKGPQFLVLFFIGCAAERRIRSLP
eukprot:SAG31_NODE_1609_length_7753_cov_12.390253_10_plen_84_part_00